MSIAKIGSAGYNGVGDFKTELKKDYKMSVNKLMILGKLGKNPEMAFTSAGKAYTKFSVAVNDGWGENQATLWYNVVMWEKLAETANTHLKKGMSVFLCGRPGYDKATGAPRIWMDKKTGEPRSSFEMTAYEMDIIWDKKDNSSGGSDETHPAREEPEEELI